MNIGIKGFNQAQEIKVELKEYPGYFINMAGLICYRRGKGYRYCQKIDKQSVLIIVDGKQTIVNEWELADKYVEGWRRFRKIKGGPNKEFTKGSLDRIVDANEGKIVEILRGRGWKVSQ